MFNRKLISVSIVSALLTSSVAVSANTKDKEENDSVNGWGKWAQNYSTAAGGELNVAALAFASLGQGETGRNGQNEAGFDESGIQVCQAGSVCGFAAINSYNYNYEENDSSSDFDVGIITGGFKVIEGDEQQALPITVNFEISGNEGYKESASGLGHQPHNHGLSFYSYDESTYDYKYIGFTNFNGNLASGYWMVDQGMMNGAGGTFVGGVTTSLAQLNSYVSGLNGATAGYKGSTLDGGHFGVIIDFGAKSWSGKFSSGMTPADSSFGVQNGAVSGVVFTADSSSLSSGNGSVTGLVSGALFGSGSDIAGMIDIEKDTGEQVVVRETLFATANLMQPN